MAVGKTSQAIDTMVRAARFNKLPIEEVEYQVKEYMAEKQVTGHLKRKTGNVLDLLRTSVMRKYTIVLWIDWLCCGLSFYGSSQYISQLGGNVFWNIALSAAVQIPGVLLCCYVIGIWGRKSTLISANIISGVALIVTGKFD